MRDLPQGWARSTLGELTEIVSGSTPKTGVAAYWGGPIPWLTPDDLSRNRSKLIGGGVRKLTAEGYASCSTTLMPEGSVLFTSRAPIGYIAIATQPVCTNQGFKSFVPSGALSSEYLYWFLRHATPRIREMGTGTTFPELSKRIAATIAIDVAPIAEQRRIVAAIEEQFSRLDAADASLGQSAARLAGLRQAILAQAVGGPWSSRPLSDVLVALRNGIFVSRPAMDPPGTAILRISAVRPLALDVDDVRYAPGEPSAFDGYLVQEDDLLFTRYSGNAEYVGACARVPALLRPTLHPDKLIRAVVNREFAEPAYVALACSAGRTRDEIRARRKTTAGQVGIAGGQLKSVPVSLPPLDEQRRIVAQVEERLAIIDQMRDAIVGAERRSTALRRSILERAFRGELVPQDPSDEPASVLLERIRAERAAATPPRRRSSRRAG